MGVLTGPQAWRPPQAAAQQPGCQPTASGECHTCAVNRITWLNRSQPQTLYSAVLLSYFSAALLLLFGYGVDAELTRDVVAGIGGLFVSDGTADDVSNTFVPLAVTLLLGGAYVAGGAGTANERRWGHWLCSAAAIYAALATLWWSVDRGFGLSMAMRLLFDGLLLVLLFHPISRSYRRVWFT